MFETIIKKTGHIVHCVFIPVVCAAAPQEPKDISNGTIIERLKAAVVTP